MPLTENINGAYQAATVSAAMLAIRDSQHFILLTAGEAANSIPGWSTVIESASSPQDFSQPTRKTHSKTDTTVSPEVTRQFRYNYTWTGGNKTQIVYQYDDGSGGGFVTVTGGTVTLTYDGSGNFTGATSA